MEAGLLSTRRASARVAVAGTVPAAAALAVVTALAALLRFWSLAAVAGNPFYDAAVRSMGQSWHNFFYGAFEPSGQVSIDKIPVDLWLQVATVKLFGFTTVATRLPGTVSGVLAVPLLYDLVRRCFGRPAGLAAAAALALLPISVLTARSDTMDSVMMLLDVLAAWLVVWGAQGRRVWPLVAAGAVMGLAFNVKLFEGLIVLPALALPALLAGDAPLRRRALGLAGGLAMFAGVSLAWVIAAAHAPLGARPWPIGSTNGGIWNVVFHFNGLDRLRVPASAAALKLDPPGALRLFSSGGHDYVRLVGTSLLAALVFGAVALGAAVLARRPAGRDRMQVATAIFLAAWLITGVALTSRMQRAQPRYLEAFTPAVAAVFGVGAGRMLAHARRTRAAGFALAAGAAATALAGTALAHPPAWAVALALGAAGTGALAAGVRRPAALTACAVVAALAVPAATSISLAGSTRSDAGLATPLPPERVRVLSTFLLAHQRGATYEVASSSVFKAGPLIVRDGRPVLMLTSYQSRPLLTPAQLAHLVATGRVRYVMVGRARCTPGGTLACVPVVRWARAHSVDVSRAAGLPRGSLSRFTAATRPTGR
jgi:4-amino-4-deoxy-L-arabinose transferase-like glycosyltransferase